MFEYLTACLNIELFVCMWKCMFDYRTACVIIVLQDRVADSNGGLVNAVVHAEMYSMNLYL